MTAKKQSQEEKDFIDWCDEAVVNEVITGWEYQPAGLQLFPGAKQLVEKKLKTKTKLVERELLRPHIYTADFVLYGLRFNHEDAGLKMSGSEVWVDTKGGFFKHNAQREVFNVNRKWVFHEHGIYVNKVVPKDFFRTTWCPASCLYKLNGERRKPYMDCLTVGQFASGLA